MISQLVDGKLFTGSHDARLIVWDARGINRDTAFGATNETNKNTASTTTSNERRKEEKVCTPWWCGVLLRGTFEGHVNCVFIAISLNINII